MKRQVFFSFEYMKDSWRAAQVRNMGKVSGESTFSDNSWEEVKEKSDEKIKQWIDSQLVKRSCLVVLIGETTANRKWINYEIQRAFELNKGIVGIYINKLKDRRGLQAKKGDNPFEYFKFNSTGKNLSNYVKCFESVYSSSDDVYRDISAHIEELIEYGISHRPSTWK
ncbi:TPA: TIR domain-containing protein [Streptococcus suis]|uniref:TIR domain-containing protein n=1 Tax=Streptococcus suis TaxID=1307 RepID=UPI002AAD98C1|nr:TIR domain-containing protein [Streptococcus suis]HEM5992588.1 TIR domain-containing protein [Streptococcus suis]HEM6007117.1 TIR domain-containing protein [Streptococcus suis]HEM6013789.1 TIR domain-containing protein [Streptococcus suis]HEM6028925.1 TIR domain-containing protein [Streptococcus suis]